MFDQLNWLAAQERHADLLRAAERERRVPRVRRSSGTRPGPLRPRVEREDSAGFGRWFRHGRSRTA
jgi:hypothetical protein